MKKVALFGGSFDPIHSKHVSIANDLLNFYDEVWLIVAAASPFKESHYASFDDRFKMCKIAFDNPRIKVLDIEKTNEFKYTYDVVKYLKTIYEYEFFFVIGSDNKSDLNKWYKYDELTNLVKFITIDRTNVSSTISRIEKECGIESVNDYIRENGLYVTNYENDFNKLKNVVNRKRYEHSIYVYSLIMKLAKAHNLDYDKCAKAAIYHDYYKDIATKEYIDEFKNNYPQYKHFSDKIMHGIIASYMLELDTEVLEAIKYHTTGKITDNMILKALYIADFCEESRSYHNEVKDILKQAFLDLNVGYEIAYKNRKDYANSNYGINEEIEKFRNS